MLHGVAAAWARVATDGKALDLADFLVHRACDRASDVHFECYEDAFRIRYRVDGSLYEVEAPPRHLALPLVARIKVMSALDITETRMPQDGRTAAEKKEEAVMVL